MKKRANLYLYLGLSLLLFSCKHEEQKTEIQPVYVDILMIDSVESGLTRTYVGEIEEHLSVSLDFPLGGTIQKLTIHEGDHVSKGELLATIDTRRAQNAYDIAKATLDQAEDGYRRLKTLHDQGSVAEVKWVEMVTNLEKAQSMEQMAKKELEECEIRAPFSGIIGKCNAEVGGRLLPGETAVSLLDMQQVAVTFTVPENEIASISIGRKAKVEIPALSHYTFYGTISEKSVLSNSISHSYQVKIGVPNANGKLLPGMVCKVHLNEPNSMGYILPAKAVQTRPEGLSVWKIKNGKAVRQAINTVEFVANGVLVTSGLEQGDTVVVAGQQKLYDNAEVIFTHNIK